MHKILGHIPLRRHRYRIPLRPYHSNRDKCERKAVTASVHTMPRINTMRHAPRNRTASDTKASTSKHLPLNALQSSEAAFSRPRQAKKLPITHTVPYPDHLPYVPQQQRKTIHTACSWHLRLNHTKSAKIQRISCMPIDTGLPASLKHGSPL